MRAASPPQQMERENEMIVISHRLFYVFKENVDDAMYKNLYEI